MKLGLLALGLTLAAAAAGSHLATGSPGEPVQAAGSQAQKPAGQSALCRRMTRYDSDSLLPLWFVCRR